MTAPTRHFWTFASAMGRVAVLIVCLLPATAAAQTGGADPTIGSAPEDVRAMITSITAYRAGGTIPELGAGIVLGVSPDSVYIATALHVVIDREERLWVRFAFAPEDSVQAVVRHASDDLMALDLAVITVPAPADPGGALMAHRGSLGDSGMLRQGDQVSPVGCPDGECWGAPEPPDRVLSAGQDIVFQSMFVKGGSSGGGLFNEEWEVVGLVTDSDPPRARAIPAHRVIQQASAWGVPITLDAPGIPRRGYGLTAGGALLQPTYDGDDRTPSLRATAAYRFRRSLDLHVSLLRLAPDTQGETCPSGRPGRARCDAVANGVLVGGAAHFRRGRAAVRPFAEVGLAVAEGRWDSGGLYVEEGYQPGWTTESTSGLIVGLGLTLDFVVIPHVVLEGVAGYWLVPDAFSEVAPDEQLDADFPPLYFGLGVRLGR